MIKRIFFFSFVFFAIRWQSPDTKLSFDAAISETLDSLRRLDNLEGWLNACMAYDEPNTAKYVAFLSKMKSRVWRGCRTDRECLAQFYFPVTLGYYQMYTGNILGSIDSYEEAYRFSVEKKIPDGEVMEYVMKPLGNDYTRLGDYDRALFVQQKGLTMALSKKDGQQAASFFSNLTTTTLSKGDLQQARIYCNKGLQLVKKDSSLYGHFLSALAEVLFESDQLTVAKEKVRQGVAVLEHNLKSDKQYSPYWLYEAYRTQGDILKQAYSFGEALRSYRQGEKIIDIYFKDERRREKAKLIVSEADVLLLVHQPAISLKKYRDALSLLLGPTTIANKDSLPAADKLYSENTLTDALKGMARSFLMLDQKEKALQCYDLVLSGERKLQKEFFGTEAKQKQQREAHQWIEDAIEISYQLWTSTHHKEYAERAWFFAEESKARLLSDEINTNLYFNSLKSKDSLIEKQSNLIQAIHFYEKNAIENAGNSLDDSIENELKFELSLVQKQVKEKYPSATVPFEEHADNSSVLERIPSKTTVVEFFTGEKSIYVLSASDHSINMLKIENADSVKKSVNDFVFNWFQNGPSKMMNAPQLYYRDAYHIYYALIHPVIKQGDRCIVIPDGVLGYLPFDALVTDSIYKNNINDWPFLTRQTSLYYAYSLQTWQQLHKIKRDKKNFDGFFISFDSSAASSLPAVKKEYEAIHAVMEGTFFRDKSSTLETFTDHLNDANILHISTHSFLEGENKVPVLQFSNGKFFLFELYGKAFRPQLVVLSACRTGQGILAEGEGILSLSRAFTASGAGGIIASLWNMNDEATASLVAAFYKELQTSHLPADALHEAKLQWLRRNRSNQFQQLPYYWAGLTYSGDNEEILVDEKKNTAAFIWIAAVLLIVPILFLFRKRIGQKTGIKKATYSS